MIRIEEFEIKWKKIFRPDLHLPCHTKRKIYNIYKARLFEDIVIEVEKQLPKQIQDYIDNLVNIKEVKI